MGVYPPDRVVPASLPPLDPNRFKPKFSWGEDREQYIAAVQQVHELIAAGDTYQVNYTVRARFGLDQEPLSYFLARALRHPVPYAAFLDLGSYQVISLSPELFLLRRGLHLESRPMKGTRPRGLTREEDIALAQDLAQSPKDQAENLMIVDMVRNDLGRVARTGSIQVPDLYTVEPYGTVWQMTSTVVGEVRKGSELVDFMQAAFPAASVTGAPKHRTMEIIRDLESEPRGVYTGTVGLFLPGTDFTCNVAIRTIVHEKGHCLLGVGSGLVWDSNPSEEYRETLAKTAFIFAHERQICPEPSGIFETMLLRPQVPRPEETTQFAGSPASEKGAHLPAVSLSRYVFLEEHLERMATSACALGLPFSRAAARALLASLATSLSETAVVRLDLSPDGNLSATTRAVALQPVQPVTLLLSPFRTEAADPLLVHKATARPLYDNEYARATSLGLFDALFLNNHERVTEGAITNLFARFGSQWLTPPVSEGLLPGVWRAAFLRESGALEHSLTLAELSQADEVLVGNSVRGPVPVGEIITHPCGKKPH